MTRSVSLVLLAALAFACSGAGRSGAPASGARDVATGGVFDWRLPPGFPVPRVPPENPMTAAKVELGRRLFFDRRLSGNQTFACATCHQPRQAFTDGLPRAAGATGELHPRGAMSLANVAYNVTLTWADPELDSLERQMLIPMFRRDPVELGLRPGGEEALARLRSDVRYRELFARAFPGAADPIGLGNLVKAIASFERTLISGDSDYDRWVYWGEEEAMPEAARRGMRLFFSPRLGCSRCHQGFNFSGPVAYAGAAPPPPAFHNTGLYDLDGRGAYPPGNRGLIEHTGRREDEGKFRAPTLRNIALTAPYMHDGSIATLAEVVDHYRSGGRGVPSGPFAGNGAASPLKSPLVTGFGLTPAERSDLVRFLESLTDREFVEDPRFTDPG